MIARTPETKQKVDEVKKEFGWYPVEEQPNICQHCRKFISKDETHIDVSYGHEATYRVCVPCHNAADQKGLEG